MLYEVITAPFRNSLSSHDTIGIEYQIGSIILTSASRRLRFRSSSTSAPAIRVPPKQRSSSSDGSRPLRPSWYTSIGSAVSSIDDSTGECAS